MIDFIKWVIYDNTARDRLWSNPLLDYYSTTETRHDDELKEVTKKEYKNFYFKKHENRLEVEGSLHKFRNNGIHNADDFKVTDCIQQVKELEELFNLNADKCYLMGLEFAVNIVPTIHNKDLILSLKYHSRKEFQRDRTHEYCKRAGSNYLTIKAYAKDIQYPQ